ncbi:MAG: hypothetical protein GX087_00640 [Desulfobulbaceae bacterium]|nr:hypothetical protein [Desulfobulbaceae bacterium]
MISNTQIRPYRYPCAQASGPKIHLAGLGLRFFNLSGQQRAAVLVLAAFACSVGLLSSFSIHAKANTVQAAIIQIQQHNTALYDENIRLLSARAQLSSKERISKIAGTRLQLFEPRADQVQRM